MKNISYWIYKGFIHTFDIKTQKIQKEFVKGKTIIKKLSDTFYLITVKSKNLEYSNIFMNLNNNQIVGSFSPNDYTLFYLTPDGKLRSKFYTIIDNKTKFGDLKLYEDIINLKSKI